MRYTTAGESHGSALVAIVENVPAGLSLSEERIDKELARRQAGYGRGARQAIESDHARILSGVRFGKTIGSPIALLIENKDNANQRESMAVSGPVPDGYEAATRPRPGHADLAGLLKYGLRDCRDVLERASARETAARVAAGSVARAFLECVGVRVSSYVDCIGGITMDPAFEPDLESLGTVETTKMTEALEASLFRCPDPAASLAMKEAVDTAAREGDTLGGSFRIVATGLVPGLGGYASGNERLGSQLGAALFSIPAIKSVEFGLGVQAATRPGSLSHDAIIPRKADGSPAAFGRKTNRAGGLEGGMTNGEPLLIRATMKAIPSLRTPLASIDLANLEPSPALAERADVCAVPAAAVVAEAEVALVLVRSYLEKFGRDSMDDILSALDLYRKRVADLAESGLR